METKKETSEQDKRGEWRSAGGVWATSQESIKR